MIKMQTLPSEVDECEPDMFPEPEMSLSSLEVDLSTEKNNEIEHLTGHIMARTCT